MSTVNFDMEIPVPQNLLKGTEAKEKVYVRKRNSFLAMIQRLSRHRLFLLTVVLPTVLAGVYFGLIASDIFVSESRFVIRSPHHKNSSTSSFGAMLGFSGGLSGAMSGGSENPAPVHDFMLSRDALGQLNDKFGLVQSFGSTKVDRIMRFGGLDPDTSFEALHRYYQKRVTIDVDANTSIATLEVEAFSPEDAYRINAMLLDMGERLVNRLNERANQDMIRFASAEVEKAEAKSKDAAVALSNFRTRKGIFDPTQQSKMQLEEATKFHADLAGAKTQLAQLQIASPNSPTIRVLQERIRSLNAEIQAENARVAGAEKSFSRDASEYERFSLDVSFADKQLSMALATLEQARNEAMRQQLYLERIVEPNRPDVAPPRRLKGFCAVFVLGMLTWGILALLIAGIREHRE
jgi:capsular polysaccharide transport system permease protein